MNFIVYKIINNFNDKVYVGQTTESLDARWKRHTGYQLNDGTYLHNSMKKHGVENYSIQEICRAKDQEELDELEYKNILKIPENRRYNLKIEKGKSGGDTLSNHPNIEEISRKISESKKGGKNPNATPVVAINILTGEKLFFDSFSECQLALNIPRHDMIGRRCRGKIKKPYNNIWDFKYNK